MRSDNHFDAREAFGAGAAALTLTLDRSDREPLSRQLYRQTRDHILSGRLPPGARLASTREMSRMLGVSRTVPLEAYAQLAAEGYLEARRGSGQYVMRLGPTAAPATKPAPMIEATAPRLDNAPFDPSSPATDIFPMRAWGHLLGRGWREDGASALTGAWAGSPQLRAAIAAHIHAMKGVDYGPDQVLITSGAEDALQLIVRALLRGDPGATAWVEDPGHNGARRVLSREGLTLAAVAVDGEGLDVEAGRRDAPRARLALVTPSRQFPLGMPLSLRRRLTLIAWAREAGALLIEDDYDSEVRFLGRPLPSLLSLDPGGSVLALGSLSKLTFPGLRLGYIAGSAALIARLAQTRAESGAVVATSAQGAMAAFIRDGGFARHLRTLRLTLSQRRRALIEALDSSLAGTLAILPQEVGMHLTVVLEGGRSLADQDLAERGLALGLNLDALSTHSVRSDGRQGFLLGYAGWDEAALAAGVDRLAALIEARR